MGRVPCCSKEQGLNRGAWTSMEDKILTDYIKTYGEGKWRNIPKKAGLNRCGKSCRLRWLNYLRPDIKRGNITHDEEELIIRLHKLLGNRWSLIAGRLPGRTDNEIKNYWNTIIGKKIINRSPSTSDQLNVNPTINQSATENPRPDPNDQFQNQNDMKNAIQSTRFSMEPSLRDPFSLSTISEQNNDIIAPTANFTMDFEVDREFLSDILNAAEFSELVASNPNTYGWSNSDQKGVTPLLTLDQQCDFQSMASIVGTDDKLGWIHQD